MICDLHGKNRIDTHSDVVNYACLIFFYPRGEHGCKYSKECAAAINQAIKDNQHWAKRKHEEYLASIGCSAKN